MKLVIAQRIVRFLTDQDVLDNLNKKQLAANVRIIAAGGMRYGKLDRESDQ